MGAKSDIEWTDASWTPIRARVKIDASDIARQRGYTSLVDIAAKMAGHVGPHCERVSPGCVNCYSETNNSRCLPNNGTGLPFDRRSRDLVDIFVDDKILFQPVGWQRPRRVFVCSQTDLFGDFVDDDMVDDVREIMACTSQHTYQVLTKRPERMLSIASKWGPLPNVWLGVSVENQSEAVARIPLLLQTPAAVRWISAEPLLGSVNLDDGESSWLTCRAGCSDKSETACTSFMNFGRCFRGIDWVVAGGESGREARPSHPDWLRALRDQCQVASVPFHFKQWGSWWPTGNPPIMLTDPGTVQFEFVGKKKAGRLLDGREWNEYPA